MPELPEVEVLRRDLSRTLIGLTIVDAELTKPRMLVAPTGMTLGDLRARRLERLDRRAKLLIFGLSSEVTMVMHLKLAGQLQHRLGDTLRASGGHPVPAFDAPLPHKSTHAHFDFDDGSRLWLTDIRQFARVILIPSELLPSLLDEKKLGVEPFDDAFTPEALAARLRRHRALPIKSALLDQANLAGLGNIYADEALSVARLHPLRPAGGLTDEEIARLHSGIRSALSFAIEHGVADLPNGRARPDSSFPRAHGRAAMPCLDCGAPIERIKVGARSTDFCPVCQR